MQRKNLPLLIVIAFIPLLMKAEWIPLNNKNTKQSPPKVTLVSNDNNSSVIKIEIAGFDLKNFNADGNEYQLADLLTESFTSKPGLPELPYIAKVLAVPDHAAISFEVLEKGDIYTFQNIKLPPARKSWQEGTPESPYVENIEAYISNKNFPEAYVKIEPPSVFRDFRIARISIFPMRYMPAKKVLEVATSITVRINYGTGDVINPKTTPKKPIAPSFAQLYQNFIFNYQEVLDADYGGKETGHELMLVIIPDDFYASFQTYAEWKRQSGIDIHITKFSDIGANATDPDIIKNHITDAYLNWEITPTYVLLVGDGGIIPTYTSSGYVAENIYVEIEGDDYFPEMMLGRFTNQSDYVMQVMINKFTMYEKTPYTTTTDWFKKGTCCSNNLYPSQVETKRYAAEKMLVDGGFTSVDTMMSDPGCTYNVSDVENAINEGRSFLNYRGEGWTSGWGLGAGDNCTPMKSSDVSNLNNGQKLPFITSIGCGVAMFDSGESFGETWIELGSLSSPRGAIAFIGPAGNTHTTYNNKIDKGIYVGMFQEGLSTAGQGHLRGKLYLYNVYGTDPDVSYHYKIYCIIGDPSIHVWKEVPLDVDVDYPAAMVFGSNLVEFTVIHQTSSLPVENAIVCVTGNDIFVTGTTDASGKALLEITAENPETLIVTVTGGNVYPYQGTMEAIPPNGPWVIRDYYLLNDTVGGNGNGMMEFSESILLSLAMENIGTFQAANVEVVLSTTDPYITLTDSTFTFDLLLPDQSILASESYAFDVADNIPDGHEVRIDITANALFDSWDSYLTIAGHAPMLSLGSFSISDPLGNNNGRIDPGETVTINTIVNNTGSSLSPLAIASLASISPYITVNTGDISLGQIVSGGSASADFEISCSPTTPIGQSIDLSLDIDAGSYGFDTTIFSNVGLLVEDWELGNFTHYPWYHTGDEDWIIVEADPYEGTYTARSGAITDNETSTMRLNLQVDMAGQVSFFRKVSSENNYDYLRFYIDDVLQDSWSGTVDWSEVSYDVTAGIHTFRWTYYKDGSASTDEDCAWVDYIVFPASTVISPEIETSPGYFTKTVVVEGLDNDILSVANTGNTPLDFTASINFIGDSKSLATVYPSHFSFATGTCTSSAKTEVSLVKAYPPDSAGWMKFDVSGIPDECTINSVEFFGFVNDNNFPYWSITPVTNDPVTAEASVLYADINDEASSGYYLYQNESGTIPNDWINHTLGGNVNTDLESALIQDWFAIGIMDRDGSSYFINFDGWNEANAPYLVVDYTLNETWLHIDGVSSVTSSVEPGNTQNINVNFDASSYPEGTYYANINISSNDQDEQQVDIPVTMIVEHGIQVSLTALLEGPFNGSVMHTDLNAELPFSQPYNIAPWNYAGTESVSSMPTNVVDWVLVELRDATSAANATPATIIELRAGLLLNDGRIVATNGSSPLSFNNTITNGMFAVIHHRNHLAIMSANSIGQSGQVYTYDFTTASGQAYGINSQKQLAGQWVMMSGDCDANRTVEIEDIEPDWSTNAGNEGYSPVDLNLDKQIDNQDKDNFWFPNMDEDSNVPQ